jgi:tRNA threonylcarbamoyladenosine modification (KEOPS) complex  Pcc1 subunit
MAKAKKASAYLELSFPSTKMANVIFTSLKPEEHLPKAAKCRAKITKRKNVLCLEVEAEDTAALRAALNSFLRWVSVARDMVNYPSTVQSRWEST